MSARSFSEMAKGIFESGRLRPLRVETGPPCTTRAVTTLPRLPVISTSISPLSISTRSPTRRWRRNPGSSTGRSAWPPSPSFTTSPLRSWRGPFSITPRRKRGPIRSRSTGMWRPCSAATRRTSWIARRWLAWSPWERFNRSTSAPAFRRWPSAASSAEAGPSVATILARRSIVGRAHPPAARTGAGYRSRSARDDGHRERLPRAVALDLDLDRLPRLERAEDLRVAAQALDRLAGELQQDVARRGSPPSRRGSRARPDRP